MDLLLKVERVS